jgi:prepilin-type processing-associated H-X9-DG protein
MSGVMGQVDYGRHKASNRLNATFCDGHVEFFRIESTYADGSDNAWNAKR